MEAKESLSDHDNVPLTASEFDQDFECREDDSVSLDGGEEFSDDISQVGQILASPSSSEVAGGREAGWGSPPHDEIP